MSKETVDGPEPRARRSLALGALQAEVRFLRAVVLLALVVLLVLFAALRVGGCAGAPREILVNGKTMAFVRDHQAAERVRKGLIADATKGLSAQGGLKESWQDVQVDVLRPEQAIKLLKGKVHVLVPAYKIMANGKQILAVPTKAMADQVLAAVKAKFTPQGAKLLEEPRFLEKVPDPVADNVPAGQVVRDPAKAAKLLVTPPAPKKGVVQAHDYPAKIAARYGLSLKQFQKLNPNLQASQMHAGDEVVIGATKAPLTVITIREDIQKKPIPPPEKKVATSTLAPGQTKVTDPGTPGQTTVVLRAVYENNSRVKISVISQKVTLKPKPRVVEVGETPPAATP